VAKVFSPDLERHFLVIDDALNKVDVLQLIVVLFHRDSIGSEWRAAKDG